MTGHLLSPEVGKGGRTHHFTIFNVLGGVKICSLFSLLATTYLGSNVGLHNYITGPNQGDLADEGHIYVTKTQFHFFGGGSDNK